MREDHASTGDKDRPAHSHAYKAGPMTSTYTTHCTEVIRVENKKASKTLGYATVCTKQIHKNRLSNFSKE